MKDIFAERLKSARVLKGYSLQDLANQLNNTITRQSLHKYEKGEVMPDSRMIGLLSDKLGLRPDYFFSKTQIELGKIEFRKLDRLPVKDESRIIEFVKDKLGRYLELEKILCIETEFVNPVTLTSAVKNLDDIEQAVADVRKEWDMGTDAVANTIELLENHHIKVVEVEAGDSFDGMQTYVNGKIPVIAVNRDKVKSADRKRFTVLHELAHLVLPLNGLSESTKEKFCHQFAAALLFPKEAAIRELGISRSKVLLPELGALKKEYGISMQAIVMRAKDLGILSDNYTRHFFFMIKQMGWKVQEPVDYIGDECSGRFEQLLYRALAEELITIGKAAQLCNKSLVDFRTSGLNFF
jgi:Zn-dependent peptidase ImmA (M78 family)/transcriptional regulator with XRE-family HTH domain